MLSSHDISFCAELHFICTCIGWYTVSWVEVKIVGYDCLNFCRIIVQKLSSRETFSQLKFHQLCVRVHMYLYREQKQQPNGNPHRPAQWRSPPNPKHTETNHSDRPNRNQTHCGSKLRMAEGDKSKAVDLNTCVYFICQNHKKNHIYLFSKHFVEKYALLKK